jgi:hypothetical protein
MILFIALLLFIFLCVLSGLPKYIREIDQEILEKHRKPVPAPEPDKEYPPLKRVK